MCHAGGQSLCPPVMKGLLSDRKSSNISGLRRNHAPTQRRAKSHVDAGEGALTRLPVPTWPLEATILMIRHEFGCMLGKIALFKQNQWGGGNIDRAAEPVDGIKGAQTELVWLRPHPDAAELCFGFTAFL